MTTLDHSIKCGPDNQIKSLIVRISSRRDVVVERKSILVLCIYKVWTKILHAVGDIISTDAFDAIAATLPVPEILIYQMNVFNP